VEDQEALARRRAELSARADERGIDWQSQVKGLPTDDDRLMVAALATLLGVDAHEAFDPAFSVDELERRAERSQAEQETRYKLAFGYTPEELRAAVEQKLHAPPTKSAGNDAS
jgi:hypothetical protein